MSVLGQKQTLRSEIAMSALPPKADSDERDRHVDAVRRKVRRTTAATVMSRLVVLINRLQQHHPVETIQLAIPLEKRAYLQPRDAPQSRILGPRRGIPD
jgi:hypothetical protein